MPVSIATRHAGRRCRSSSALTESFQMDRRTEVRRKPGTVGLVVDHTRGGSGLTADSAGGGADTGLPRLARLKT
jgi:hypothetical protein